MQPYLISLIAISIRLCHCWKWKRIQFGWWWLGWCSTDTFLAGKHSLAASLQPGISSTPHSKVQESSLINGMQITIFIESNSLSRITQPSRRAVFMLLSGLFLLLFSSFSPDPSAPSCLKPALSLLFWLDYQMLYICVPDAASQWVQTSLCCSVFFLVNFSPQISRLSFHLSD